MTQITITEKQQACLEFLKARPGQFVKPTEVGNALSTAPDGTSPSAWASPILKRLVKRGLVERNERGHYKAK